MLFIIMIRKLAVVFIAFLVILPVGNVLNLSIKSHENEDNNIEKENTHFQLRISKWSDWDWKNQMGFYIHTKYDGIEKDTPVLQSIFSGIDVDDDPSTGVNGKDVKVSIIALPLIQQTDVGFVFTLSLALKVIRLGDEIKNGEFEITFGGSITFNGVHHFKIGYYSADGEEIPRELREVVTIVPYIFYDKDPEFYINIEPVFDNGNENVSAILAYSNANFGDHTIIIDYFPALDTMIKVTPSIGINKFGFSIERYTDIEQTIRMRYIGEMAINLTIEDIPREMAFSLSFAENYFEYEASDEFNASLIIEYREMEFVMKIEYLPRHLIAQFDSEGYFYINVDERKTKFIVANALENPTMYFSVTNLTGESIVRWNIGGEGYLTIDGFTGLQIEIKFEMGEVYFKIYSILQTEHFKISWNLSIPGYVFIDSNNEWLSFYSFNFTIGDVFGILIEANFIRANNYRVEWQTSTPFFTTDGEFDFVGNITFAIMLNGTWYYLFS